MLCRVAAYSEPGFPRPAMSRIGGSVSSTGSCRRHSERSEAQRNKIEESRGITLRFGCGIPRLRCAPLGMTTVTSSLSPLELFLSPAGAGAAASPSSFFSVITSGPAAAASASAATGCFLNDRRHDGEGRQIDLHLWRYTLWKLNVADVNGIADVQLRNVHRDPIRQIAPADIQSLMRASSARAIRQKFLTPTDVPTGSSGTSA